MKVNHAHREPLTVAFHFDATAGTGLGHFNRCLNLAETFQRRRTKVLFYLCADTAGHLEKRKLLDNLSIETVVVGPPSTACIIEFCHSTNIDVLLIDNYQFNLKSEIDLRQHVFLVMIDDHLFDHRSHVILNHRPSLTVEILTHEDETQTCVLGGSKYCLAKATPKVPEITNIVSPTVLVHAGGSDLYLPFLNFYKAVLEYCRLNSISVDVLLADKKAVLPSELKNYVHENPDTCRTVSFDVPLREELHRYDAVIGPAGTTTYETLIAGSLPLSFEITDDGRDSKSAWAVLGHLFHLSFSEVQDPKPSSDIINLFMNNFDKATELIDQAPCKLDGLGCERVVDDVIRCYNAHFLPSNFDISSFSKHSSEVAREFFEPCNSSDALDFLASRNNERARSSSTDPSHRIHWIDHLAWWIDSRIRRYKVFDDSKGSIEGYFWIKQLILNDVRYFTSGWFPSTGFHLESGLSLGLKIMKAINQEVNRSDKPGLWVITMKPENQFALHSNRRFGFKPSQLNMDLLEKLYPGSQNATLLAMSKLIHPNPESA